MPEGPEIKLAADQVASAIEGCVVTDVWFAFERLKHWQRRLEGQRIRAVQPRGKAMLVRFPGGLNLYSHNQLYGRWYVTRAGRKPQTGRQLRVALHTSRSSALLYSASEIEVLRDSELVRHPYLSRLGLEVLDPSVTALATRHWIEQDRFARRTLGGLLLDQGFLSGVGNYLRSEILFAAGVDAGRRPIDLVPSERKALARAALTITRRAYRTRGLTNDPRIVTRMRREKRTRSEYRHFVFGREGEPCHRCGTAVVKSQAAGRRLYSCPACQR